MTEIRCAAEYEDEARNRILALLDSHSKAIGKSFKTEKLFYEAHENGQYLGGLCAHFALDLKWVFIELLAVAAVGRGKGIGRELMLRMEEEARLRGMQGIWLDTFSFQAPEFYKRLGFSEFGQIDGYPEDGARHFFLKRL